MVSLFSSFFQNSSPVGLGLALVFGIIWLVIFLPPFHRKPWLLAVLVISAFLTLAAIAFIQVPLQSLIGNALIRVWGSPTVIDWILLTAIPGILLSGFVQEGAKMVPQVVFWLGQGKKLSPQMGLCLGAVAGAGYGIFETNWIHGLVFTSGWSWSVVNDYGFLGLTPFVERFFVTAFHIGASALAGYGLARGWGWQFYLVAALSHAVLNYLAILLQASVLSISQFEIVNAVWALLVIAAALWLRWGNEPPEALPAIETPPESASPAQPSP
jgi:RsiW-degrading membrane proteinase PrsW (M82 family)